MTQAEAPKVVKKKLFSPIWLLPIVALALGSWLGVKSIKESGIEVQVHFPSATGIDVGKTLIKYQGLTVGKVVDIGIDEQLSGVNVDILMDYRAEPFLNQGTQFWLVTPKASITGVEGLDALFSGNYIGVQPGEGEAKYSFEAEKQAPAMLPGTEGVIIELEANKLGSIDVGSPVFYRQIPVGNVVSYRLENQSTVRIDTFIQEQYAYLVKKESNFWNVSGLSIDASLSGIKINSESLAALIAGGISFDSPENGVLAQNGDNYTLYNDEKDALGGVHFELEAANADRIKKGAAIEYRGIQIGHVLSQKLDDDGVIFIAKLDPHYANLLTKSAIFWAEGAQVSLDGVKHADRFITGDIINFIPGSGAAAERYTLLDAMPDILATEKLKLTLTSTENPGIKAGSQVRYKQINIGEVMQAKLNLNLDKVEYQIEVWPEFTDLVTQGSYFVAESALSVEASLQGVAVKTRDIDTLLKGAISLVTSPNTHKLKATKNLHLFANRAAAEDFYTSIEQFKHQLTSHDGAGLNVGSPVYYKKMKIGEVQTIDWSPQPELFNIGLALNNEFSALIRDNTVFWRNDAVTINASLAGVDVNVAPVEGALKGSISLGILEQGKQGDTSHLYDNQSLAMKQAMQISLVFPASAKLSSNAAIRYQGHQVGTVQKVTLDNALSHINVDAYLYGDYAQHFTKQDTQYFLVEAQVSLNGVEAVDTLISGPYIGVQPGTSAATSRHFTANSTTPILNQPGDLMVQLEDRQLGSLKVGTKLFYRGIAIGQVDQYQLAPHGDKVILMAHIGQKYRHLVNQSSQFWHLSGIKVDLGLFSGAQIDAGSLETILTGGIGVVTEHTTDDNNRVSSPFVRQLKNKANPQWFNWAPVQVSNIGN